MAATRSWPRGPRHRLPRTITPFADEAASSYTARLAHANHISTHTLRSYVAHSYGARPRHDWLATVSGQPEQVITTRLRGLAGDHTPLIPHLHRPLCQRCMAGKTIHEPVYCYLPAHRTVCQRHHRWIGPPAHTVDDQIDLHDRPQVLRAARTHHRLARQHTDTDVRAALRGARHMLVYWAHAEHTDTAPILHTGLHACVSAYPELIIVAATVLAAGAAGEHTGHPPRSNTAAMLIEHLNDRLEAHHVDTTPVQRWVHTRWRRP